MAQTDSSNEVNSITTSVEIGLVRNVVGEASNIYDYLLNNQPSKFLVISFFLFYTFKWNIFY